MARRHVGRARGGPRREFSWFEIEPVSAVLTVAGGTIFNSMSAVELARRPFTIMRTHLTCWIESDQSAASEKQLAAIGLAVVSDQAAAAGVGSIPTPITDDDSDLWFVHKFLMSNFLFASGVGFAEGQSAGMLYEVDSKAMRKVNDGEDIVVVAEVDAVIGGGVVVTTAGRLLIKNH